MEKLAEEVGGMVKEDLEIVGNNGNGNFFYNDSEKVNGGYLWKTNGKEMGEMKKCSGDFVDKNHIEYHGADAPASPWPFSSEGTQDDCWEKTSGDESISDISGRNDGVEADIHSRENTIAVDEQSDDSDTVDIKIIVGSCSAEGLGVYQQQCNSHGRMKIKSGMMEKNMKSLFRYRSPSKSTIDHEECSHENIDSASDTFDSSSDLIDSASDLIDSASDIIDNASELMDSASESERNMLPEGDSDSKDGSSNNIRYVDRGYDEERLRKIETSPSSEELTSSSLETHIHLREGLGNGTTLPFVDQKLLSEDSKEGNSESGIENESYESREFQVVFKQPSSSPSVLTTSMPSSSLLSSSSIQSDADSTSSSPSIVSSAASLASPSLVSSASSLASILSSSIPSSSNFLSLLGFPSYRVSNNPPMTIGDASTVSSHTADAHHDASDHGNDSSEAYGKSIEEAGFKDVFPENRMDGNNESAINCEDMDECQKDLDYDDKSPQYTCVEVDNAESGDDGNTIVDDLLPENGVDGDDGSAINCSDMGECQSDRECDDKNPHNTGFQIMSDQNGDDGNTIDKDYNKNDAADVICDDISGTPGDDVPTCCDAAAFYDNSGADIYKTTWNGDTIDTTVVCRTFPGNFPITVVTPGLSEPSTVLSSSDGEVVAVLKSRQAESDDESFFGRDWKSYRLHDGSRKTLPIRYHYDSTHSSKKRRKSKKSAKSLSSSIVDRRDTEININESCYSHSTKYDDNSESDGFDEHAGENDYRESRDRKPIESSCFASWKSTEIDEWSRTTKKSIRMSSSTPNILTARDSGDGEVGTMEKIIANHDDGASDVDNKESGRIDVSAKKNRSRRITTTITKRTYHCRYQGVTSCRVRDSLPTEPPRLTIITPRARLDLSPSRCFSTSCPPSVTHSPSSSSNYIRPSTLKTPPYSSSITKLPIQLTSSSPTIKINNFFTSSLYSATNRYLNESISQYNIAPLGIVPLSPAKAIALLPIVKVSDDAVSAPDPLNSREADSFRETEIEVLGQKQDEICAPEGSENIASKQDKGGEDSDVFLSGGDSAGANGSGDILGKEDNDGADDSVGTVGKVNRGGADPYEEIRSISTTPKEFQPFLFPLSHSDTTLSRFDPSDLDDPAESSSVTHTTFNQALNSAPPEVSSNDIMYSVESMKQHLESAPSSNSVTPPSHNHPSSPLPSRSRVLSSKRSSIKTPPSTLSSIAPYSCRSPSASNFRFVPTVDIRGHKKRKEKAKKSQENKRGTINDENDERSLAEKIAAKLHWQSSRDELRQEKPSIGNDATTGFSAAMDGDKDVLIRRSLSSKSWRHTSGEVLFRRSVSPSDPKTRASSRGRQRHENIFSRNFMAIRSSLRMYSLSPPPSPSPSHEEILQHHIIGIEPPIPCEEKNETLALPQVDETSEEIPSPLVDREIVEAVPQFVVDNCDVKEAALSLLVDSSPENVAECLNSGADNPGGDPKSASSAIDTAIAFLNCNKLIRAGNCQRVTVNSDDECQENEELSGNSDEELIDSAREGDTTSHHAKTFATGDLFKLSLNEASEKISELQEKWNKNDLINHLKHKIVDGFSDVMTAMVEEMGDLAIPGEPGVEEDEEENDFQGYHPNHRQRIHVESAIHGKIDDDLHPYEQYQYAVGQPIDHLHTRGPIKIPCSHYHHYLPKSPHQPFCRVDARALHEAFPSNPSSVQILYQCHHYHHPPSSPASIPDGSSATPSEAISAFPSQSPPSHGSTFPLHPPNHYSPHSRSNSQSRHTSSPANDSNPPKEQQKQDEYVKVSHGDCRLMANPCYFDSIVQSHHPCPSHRSDFRLHSSHDYGRDQNHQKNEYNRHYNEQFCQGIGPCPTCGHDSSLPVPRGHKSDRCCGMMMMIKEFPFNQWQNCRGGEGLERGALLGFSDPEKNVCGAGDAALAINRIFNRLVDGCSHIMTDEQGDDGSAEVGRGRPRRVKGRQDSVVVRDGERVRSGNREFNQVADGASSALASIANRCTFLTKYLDPIIYGKDGDYILEGSASMRKMKEQNAAMDLVPKSQQTGVWWFDKLNRILDGCNEDDVKTSRTARPTCIEPYSQVWMKPVPPASYPPLHHTRLHREKSRENHDTHFQRRGVQEGDVEFQRAYLRAFENHGSEVDDEPCSANRGGALHSPHQAHPSSDGRLMAIN